MDQQLKLAKLNGLQYLSSLNQGLNPGHSVKVQSPKHRTAREVSRSGCFRFVAQTRTQTNAILSWSPDFKTNIFMSHFLTWIFWDTLGVWKQWQKVRQKEIQSSTNIKELTAFIKLVLYLWKEPSSFVFFFLNMDYCKQLFPTHGLPCS